MKSSVYPDQLTSEKSADLVLHCFKTVLHCMTVFSIVMVKDLDADGWLIFSHDGLQLLARVLSCFLGWNIHPQPKNTELGRKKLH